MLAAVAVVYCFTTSSGPAVKAAAGTVPDEDSPFVALLRTSLLMGDAPV
jgi:hypothetical protein